MVHFIYKGTEFLSGESVNSLSRNRLFRLETFVPGFDNAPGGMGARLRGRDCAYEYACTEVCVVLGRFINKVVARRRNSTSVKKYYDLLIGRLLRRANGRKK